ncbi:MAG: presqualene diphosphate synthase HpnD [Zymomonas mobilis subsp. pomaceae]|uniref:Squalene synthase HpnD n=1 Tax=Zymomonas mobilis subsp. pomaceae (strain ATCC 29192 / DSM 22645 / JCM 10191 / CCUG 17912 / NBRC 13757 / NCIMB 11200 / NRRL B-4491 / Barker I) TaxID=579138 RepID=F8EV10_ZYMMT|nr:presqualene diphosphate synthase HpnD [Zymomonas mobilis]AEI37298.1 squalene synthase HpnD [Zymomonas mobilis subsp. pomaceae ATCC 29192]MDX5948667.1 presqualene diphosphate synthase HpnD [Zymomonas mobilis subsp. pomaceae]GEB88472.1 squalene synthase HpnD [Zymomonas mobilis subsp. pomaceae]
MKLAKKNTLAEETSNTVSETRAISSGAKNSSFYIGMRVLPLLEREAMYAVYSFCRQVDDIADDLEGSAQEREHALEQWRSDIDALYNGKSCGQARFLKESVAHFHLKKEDFVAVIDGMAMDLKGPIQFPDEATLDLYCDRVASAVGRMSVRIFGMDTEIGEQLAYHLGRALQLTNILRDLDEDATINRCYLPREPLEAAGIPLDIDKALSDPRLDSVCRALAWQAEGHYAASDHIIIGRPKGHLIAPRLMAAAYSALLRKMLAQGWKAPRKKVRHNKLALLWTLLRLKVVS